LQFSKVPRLEEFRLVKGDRAVFATSGVGIKVRPLKIRAQTTASGI